MILQFVTFLPILSRFMFLKLKCVVFILFQMKARVNNSICKTLHKSKMPNAASNIRLKSPNPLWKVWHYFLTSYFSRLKYTQVIVDYFYTFLSLFALFKSWWCVYWPQVKLKVSELLILLLTVIGRIDFWFSTSWI